MKKAKRSERPLAESGTLREILKRSKASTTELRGGGIRMGVAAQSAGFVGTELSKPGSTRKVTADPISCMLREGKLEGKL